MAETLYERMEIKRPVGPAGQSIPRLRALVEEALTFGLDEFDPSPLGRGANDHVRELHRLRTQLAGRFFDSIHVDRPESDQLIAAARRTPGLTLLSGPRGSGKSTMLLRLHHQLDDEFRGGTEADVGGRNGFRLDDLPSHSVHYLNLKRAGTALRGAAVPGQRDRRVCGLLYDLLLDHLVPTAERSNWQTVDADVSEFFARFRDFQLQHAESFRGLWKSIELRVLAQRVAPEKLIAASEDLAARYEQAEEAFATNDEDQLTTLLRFLSASYGHRCVFLIDNVDRYSQRFHVELVERIRELAHSVLDVGFVVGIRSDNVDVILDQRHADATISNIELDATVDVIDESGATRPLAEEVFRSRVGFLTAFLAVATSTGNSGGDSPAMVDPIYRNDVLDRELAEAGFGDIDGFLVRARLLSDELRIRQSAAATPTFTTLMDWHNQSLRSALAQLFDVASCALTGQDVFFPRPLSSSRGGHPFAKRDFQNLLLRHLIFGGRRFPNRPTTIRVFDGDRRVEGPPLRFQRLKILQLLAAHHGTMRFGRIVETFRDLGVSQDVVLNHIIDLSSTRGFESEGLVSADVTHVDDEQTIANDSPVILRSSGRLFLTEIAVSCEYLFWSAMLARPEDWPDYPQRWRRLRLSEADVDDELTRAEIAREFVESLLLPRALAELEASSLTAAQAELHRERLRTNFATSHDEASWFIVLAACGSIGAFLHTSNGDEARRADLERRADRLQQSVRRSLSRAAERDLAAGTDSGLRGALDLRSSTRPPVSADGDQTADDPAPPGGGGT